MVKITICGEPNTLGSSNVPTLMIKAPGRADDFARMCVPHSGQNSRVTGFSKSLRRYCLGDPLVYEKPDSGMAMTTFGCPPEMYWHSRQWHCPLKSGSPVAS